VNAKTRRLQCSHFWMMFHNPKRMFESEWSDFSVTCARGAAAGTEFWLQQSKLKRSGATFCEAYAPRESSLQSCF